MRMSQYLLPTVKENPSDAETVSHRLMIRSGMIRKVAAGIYSYLPMGLKVIRKVEEIVREEMNRAGAIELLMPSVLPAELWKESGRWEVYGKELLRFKDRGDREFCLGPTHEEVITDIVRKEIRSYRQLPKNFYQIQTKFRDEIRPRFGLMRGREFIMKDAYSFDIDDEGACGSYGAMYEAYVRIFRRIGLQFKAVEADTGSIGGSSSHEFMVIADSGEDEIASCKSCDYGANTDLAEAALSGERKGKPFAVEEPKEFHTPGKKSIEDVCEFMGVSPTCILKTLIFNTDQGVVAVVARGDKIINEVKVKNQLGAHWIALAEEEIIRNVTGTSRGFAGPVGLSATLYADYSAMGVRDGITGANRDDYHLIHVVPGRDFQPTTVGDFRQIEEGDPCPNCGGKISISRGIEVGHIFRLGSKYSRVMGATFLDSDGKEKVMEMGCYGIGIGRTVAAAIEQNHDEDGIVWPLAIAPFSVQILPVNKKKENVRKVSENLYGELVARGVDVLIDDREERPGIKFKDADLIGVPLRITVGEKKVKEGKVEMTRRRTGDPVDITITDAVSTLIYEIEKEFLYWRDY